MIKLRTISLALLSVMATVMTATDYTVSGQYVTIPVKEAKEGGAQVVRLQVVNDNIIRVQATPENKLPEKQSLIIVKQTQAPKFTVTDGDEVCVKAARVEARVDKKTGGVTFYDANGKVLLKESKKGKTFKPFRVPDREIGVDVAKVPEAQRNGLSWRLLFDSKKEAIYGLGQHQSEELNMKGLNEDLFQYNTKVSVPFILSSKNYGLLWDSYSYCRWGNPEEYVQLGKAFKIYDKQGREGHLTGTYTDKNGKQIVRDEDSIYYEFDCPTTSQLANQTESGGIKNLPKDIKLNGAQVVYEGFIEAPQDKQYHFILYYAGYIKVYIGGKEVVAERWRTAWNPNTYKFRKVLEKGKRYQLRIEWRPDGDVSYCGLRVAKPNKQQNKISIWSEMAKDMDYYFIAGENADEIISGYRTLTGKAPVYPKWVLGFWQSRERYKTSEEIENTLAEFRKRQIPCDNIVQDWNYWKEDQWGSHQFEASRFPNPQAMIDSVHQMGGHFMISVWPKFYCNTENYKALDAKGWMYHQAVVDDIHDWVGPGYVGSFYDAYDAGARKLFWQQMDKNLYTGLSKSSSSKSSNSKYIDAWWMDASEPNVRDCTPMWYRKALSGPTALGTTTEYFNAYSIVNADAIYNGQRSVNPNQRVFLLTRSGFAGEQRYSTATWSGDIGTRWEDMRAQMTAGLNYSMSGLPFWGMDQGGFCVENRYMQAQSEYERTGVENEDLKEWRELQARWSQFGTFIPLFRVHGQWPLREIWNLAPENHPCYQSFVYYDKLRYRLMPYLYSMAGWVHLKDYTMMRGLIMDFNGDWQVTNIKDQWMFGPALMACPVAHYKARNRSVYFPKQTGWYNLYSGEYVEGGQSLIVDAPYERIPVFVREGSIIPFGPEIQYSDEKPAELINLYVYAGKDGQFMLYEDEGVNYNYEKGKYATIDITYDDSSKTITFGKRNGQFNGMLKQRRFNVVLITREQPKALNMENPEGKLVQYNGKAVSIQL
ncbi:alpha-D-xyloside xylohydrolase [Prevotella sp. tc2-28]|nr:TIM-barrel domain-containing protein [Prevotella sp. tc2-28]SDZ91976.1 alpha-D-xyloside xylohydrolase [Prevotella sp. tc2-28]